MRALGVFPPLPEPRLPYLSPVLRRLTRGQKLPQGTRGENLSYLLEVFRRAAHLPSGYPSVAARGIVQDRIPSYRVPLFADRPLPVVGLRSLPLWWIPSGTGDGERTLLMYSLHGVLGTW